VNVPRLRQAGLSQIECITSGEGQWAYDLQGTPRIRFGGQRFVVMFAT